MRVGLVGCGGMGNRHLQILAQMQDIEVVGVCDHRPERAERMAKQHQLPFWIDFPTFLEEANPQALHITSPTGYHADQGIVAAQRGIHLLCEKPIDIDIEKVDRLLETCRNHKVRIGCIFQKRTSPAAQAVQRAISEGKMGSLISCSASVKWWRSQQYYDKDDWRGTWRWDGGAFANQGIHTLDMMVWMAGAVAEVEYAHLETRTHRMEAEDFGIVVVRFENGARGTIEITTCCLPDLATRLEVYGTKGSASFDDAKVVHYGLDGQDMLPQLPGVGMLTGGGSDPWEIDLSGHQAQIHDFYLALHEDRSPMIDGSAARVSIDLLTKIYAKAFPYITPGRL